MRAMQITRQAPVADQPGPLHQTELATPEPGPGEVLVRVHVCGVCHTEIDEIEGRLPPAELPFTPGHQVVGKIVAEGPECKLALVGQRVGIAWIFSACGDCVYCNRGQENLCSEFRGTGRDAPGGYAEYMTVPEAYAHPLPESLSDIDAAPLLCAGAVGYRALRLCRLREGESLGLTGFGASGHLVLQMAKALYPDSDVYVFARDPDERAFALDIGADWAGDTRESPPGPVHAIIDTTPAWLPVVSALDALAPGGRLVINAIRKEDGDREALEHIDYARHLWREKSVSSVANLTRCDVRECLELAASGGIRPRTEVMPLLQANTALKRIRRGGLRGAFVLRMAKTGANDQRLSIRARTISCG